MAGYGSHLVVSNLGSLAYMFMAHFLLIPVVLLLRYCGKKFPKVRTVSEKANRYLFWGGSIRFFMEGYLDFCTLSFLNIQSLDWESQLASVNICNYMSIFIVFLACFLPVFVLVWYICRMHAWHTDEFKASWGFMLDDLAIDENDA